MKIYRKMRLSALELSRLREELDDYVWIAIDLEKSSICAGDSYIGELRDVLLEHRSRVEDIFCIGLDLATGEINYLKTFNRRNPTVGYGGEVSDVVRSDINHLIEYFFGGLPIFEAQRKREKYAMSHIIPSFGVC